MAFTELNADARDSILNRLGFLREQGEDLVGQVVNELEQTLAAEGVKAQVLGREKAYSIWRKMQRRDVEFGQLSDIVAFGSLSTISRIVTERWALFTIAIKLYRAVLRTTYQSRNPTAIAQFTGIMGPQMQQVEVQIRTQSMDEITELGVAAHWQYKQGDSDPVKEASVSLAAGTPGNSRACSRAGRVPRAYQARDVCRSSVLLHAKRRLVCDAVRRDAGGFCLCGAHGCRKYMLQQR